MRRYTIKYTNAADKEVVVSVKANTALDAAERYANRYGWDWRENLVDAETRGEEWTTGHFLKPEYGYNQELYAEIISK